MSTPINDGGPAFPVFPHQTQLPSPGMTLRQYYAAAALTGILSNPQSGSAMGRVSGKQLADAVAEASFAYADAMIKHQEGQQ